jgi:hypothetical protein
MEEEDILPANLLERKTFIQAELMRLLEEEEIYWHKRFNEKWLLQGDNNTYYFHKKENGKKERTSSLILKRMVKILTKMMIWLSMQLNTTKNYLDPLIVQLFH